MAIDDPAAVPEAGDLEGLHIVAAGENDADLVGIMVNELLHEIGAWHDAPDDESIHEICQQLIGEASSFTALLAFDGKRRPVGVLTLGEAVAIYAKGKFGIIMETYVVPDARSTGIGERLIEEAMKIGREKGWSLLEVNTPDGAQWSRTQSFYERQGFKTVGPFLKLEL